MSARIFNPDAYLQTPQGRIYTSERNAQAWEQLYRDLAAALKHADPARSRLYLVMGLQGGGKTHWIAQQEARSDSNVLFLDAALPARRHRQRAIGLAREHGIPVIGVWVQVTLELALSRNARRTGDELVPEAAIRSVFSMLEPPCTEEGFTDLMMMDATAAQADAAARTAQP
ncbi:kinase [Corticibacter populi]|uniref:Kinase n=1 Tax=Corticibacter populi TaxID=1550736 RepID=A0A3M6R063_9BURK|nr:AAA family ATPase [Corticibacter populi]RMX08640.1 kinase [Corticibacter populi]RZS35972.1 AAA domain-containing protein [Corticibacter populi]